MENHNKLFTEVHLEIHLDTIQRKILIYLVAPVLVQKDKYNGHHNNCS